MEQKEDEDGFEALKLLTKEHKFFIIILKEITDS